MLALTTAVLTLVFAGVLFADDGDAIRVAPTAPPRTLATPTTTLSGWLHTLYGDEPAGGGHLHMHLLVDDAGQAAKLAIPESVIESAGGRDAVNHRRVTVSGPSARGAAALSSADQVLPVHTLTVDGAKLSLSGLGALDGGVQAAVTGSQRWATILCRFGDSPAVTPFPKSWFETLMLGSTTAPSLDHYWRQVSYGAVNLIGSVVVGWYTLPQPRSYYVYGNPLALDHQRAAQDCTTAANADVHFPNFVGINLMFNQDLDCCAWGGSTTLNADGQNRMYRMTWLPPWGYASQGPVAHEMGHGFGLPHSSGPYQALYDSRWDVMSDVWGNCPPLHPVYGCVGTHTISYHKDLLGWIPESRRYVAATGTSQTIALEPLDQLASSGYMIARIPIPGSTTKFYTVETRRRLGYDAPLPANAVVIHLVDTTRSDRDAQVVDPDGNGNPDDAGAMWLPGESFVDAANNIRVAVVSQTTNGFLVTVENGKSTTAPPTARIAVDPTSIAFGTVTIGKKRGNTVTVRNAGGAALVIGKVTLKGAAPEDFKLKGVDDLCSGRSLSPGQSCTLFPRFRPLTAGVKTVDVVIPSNDPNAKEVKVALSGTGTSPIAPDIRVEPAALSFGTVRVGINNVKTVTVANDGAANLVLGVVKLATSTTDVAISQDLCSGQTILPGQSCAIGVRVRAFSAGQKSGTLTITSNDADEATVTVGITATAQW